MFLVGQQQIGLCVMTAIQKFGKLARKFYKVLAIFRILIIHCQVKKITFHDPVSYEKGS